MSVERQALLHSYLVDGRDRTKPDKLTRASMVAAARLLKDGEIDKIVVAVKDPISSTIKNRFKKLLPNSFSPNKFLFLNETTTTRQELFLYQVVTRESDFHLAIGNKEHVERIKRLSDKNFNDKELLIFETYIDCDEQKKLKKQEKVLNTLVKVPFFGELVVDIVPGLIPGKIFLQSLFLK